VDRLAAEEGVIRLPVAHLWDGRPALAHEQALVTLELSDEGLVVSIEAPDHGDPLPAAAPGSTPRLWNHEVVEVFVVGLADPPVYTELEVGPAGHYLGLQLVGVRKPVVEGFPVEVSVEKGRGSWTGRALVPYDRLPPRPWKVNAYAIHGEGESRRYLCHTPLPGPHPDFHRLEGFEVQVP
jgi:hypothetical protein